MFTKLATAQIKAVGPGESTDLAEGQFEAIVSVFNVVDSYGDVVMPGAFQESLEEWEAKGTPLPIIWSHQWTDPFAHIGYSLKAEETERGLWVRGQLDHEDNPTAGQAYKLLLQRRISQFSFGFEVKEAGWGTRKSADDGSERDVYELRKLGLYEVGPCLVGVNPQTELLAVKGQPSRIAPQRKGVPGSATPVPIPASTLAWTSIKEMQEETP